eukprot:sb/3477243/
MIRETEYLRLVGSPWNINHKSHDYCPLRYDGVTQYLESDRMGVGETDLPKCLSSRVLAISPGFSVLIENNSLGLVTYRQTDMEYRQSTDRQIDRKTIGQSDRQKDNQIIR